MHARRQTSRPIPRFNYELFNCNNLNIRYWSWNYRGCWHQTCPPMDPPVSQAPSPESNPNSPSPVTTMVKKKKRGLDRHLLPEGHLRNGGTEFLLVTSHNRSASEISTNSLFTFAAKAYYAKELGSQVPAFVFTASPDKGDVANKMISQTKQFLLLGVELDPPFGLDCGLATPYSQIGHQFRKKAQLGSQKPSGSFYEGRGSPKFRHNSIPIFDLGRLSGRKLNNY
ncbi:unnamed protein product [Cochlearia groenlandica]